MGFEFCFVESVEHEEEVFDVAEVFAWKVVLTSDSVSEGVGGDGGYDSE